MDQIVIQFLMNLIPVTDEYCMWEQFIMFIMLDSREDYYMSCHVMHARLEGLSCCLYVVCLLAFLKGAPSLSPGKLKWVLGKGFYAPV